MFTCKGCREVTRLVGEIEDLRQMMESMKRIVQWRIVGSRGPGARNSVGPSATCLNWGSGGAGNPPPSGVRGRAPEAKHFGNNILKIG